MNIEQVLHNALCADDSEQLEWIRCLCQAVKQLDNYGDTNDLLPVERALPQLAEHLVWDGEEGSCVISIFRRCSISKETIDQLLRLFRLHSAEPPWLVVEALGRCGPNEWTNEVELALREALTFSDANSVFPGNIVYHALQAFHQYSFRQVPLSIETLKALATIAHDNAERKNYRHFFRTAVNTLAKLTTCEHGEAALQLLEGLLASAGPPYREEIATALGVFSDRGLSLLEELAADSNREVRIATAKALGRGYLDRKEAKKMLKKMQKKDSDPLVRTAAKQALLQGGL